MDIHKIGGGIGFTVRHVHETQQLITSVIGSSEDALLELLLPRLKTMMKHGTTYPILLFIVDALMERLQTVRVDMVWSQNTK